jgi:hypothetical protein
LFGFVSEALFLTVFNVKIPHRPYGGPHFLLLSRGKHIKFYALFLGNIYDTCIIELTVCDPMCLQFAGGVDHDTLQFRAERVPLIEINPYPYKAMVENGGIDHLVTYFPHLVGL